MASAQGRRLRAGSGRKLVFCTNVTKIKNLSDLFQAAGRIPAHKWQRPCSDPSINNGANCWVFLWKGTEKAHQI